jgi:hypothetical protein
MSSITPSTPPPPSGAAPARARTSPDQTTSADASYAAGSYWQDEHADWLTNKPTKQVDFVDGLLAAVDASGKKSLRVADIGAGTGWTMLEALQLAQQARPGVSFTPVCYEIAPDAVAVGRAKFPDLDIRQKPFDPADGPFDIAMLIDVLEHLENPWQMLRDVGAAADYLVVRQPLLTSLSTFRNSTYRSQRESLGHIAFYDVRQFKDMAYACGWEPLKLDLVALWEWPVNKGMKAPWWKKMLVNWNRELMSYIMSGFYLNGSFRRRAQSVGEAVAHA